MHDGFKVNKPVSIVKIEQQYVITIIKILDNKAKSPRLDKKNILLLHVSFILTHLMIVVPFLKVQAITPCFLHFFSKYFLHCQHSDYIRVAIDTDSLILI